MPADDAGSLGGSVRADGCGVTARWDVAVERWDETTSCATDGGVLRTAFVAYHQFFRSGDTDTCSGDPRPIGGAEGTTWSFQCVEGDLVTSWSGTVLGAERVAVGETTVPTDHVLLVTSGEEAGENDMRIETWYLAGSDLTVREIGSRRTTDPSPIGDVHYHEDYEIVLTSLEPHR